MRESINNIRYENTTKRGTGIQGTYLARLARFLRDMGSRPETMRKEGPFDVYVCNIVDNRVDLRCFEVVWVKGFGGSRPLPSIEWSRRAEDKNKCTYLTGLSLADFVSRTVQEPVFPPVLCTLFTPAFSFSAFSFATESLSPTHLQYAVTLGSSAYCRSKSDPVSQRKSPAEDGRHFVLVHQRRS